MWYSHRKFLSLLLVSLACAALVIGAGTKRKKTEPTRSTTATVEREPASSSNKPVQQQTVVLTTSVQGQSTEPRSSAVRQVRGVATGEQIRKQIISSGGGIAVSLNYSASQVTGQALIGNTSSENYGADQGFMASGPTDCCQNRGNVDDIFGPGGPVDVSDLTYLVAYLFQGGPAPLCDIQGNVDNVFGPGGPIDVSDLTYIVAYLFQGGPQPPLC